MPCTSKRVQALLAALLAVLLAAVASTWGHEHTHGEEECGAMPMHEVLLEGAPGVSSLPSPPPSPPSTYITCRGERHELTTRSSTVMTRALGWAPAVQQDSETARIVHHPIKLRV